MEIKQLEYFVTAVDQGSLNRAAEQLYTTQPNVSKVIGALERELRVPLFERSNRGIRMTAQGELLYSHAASILKHSHIIRSMMGRQCARKFSVSGYQSSLLTKLLAELYNDRAADGALKYEYREGTVEEITDQVSGHVSEIGVVYLAKDQMPCFKHIIGHKNLEYVPLDDRGICVYVGKNHPFFKRSSIEFTELAALKFVEGTDDFYAMEHHIERVSIGAAPVEYMENVFFTNSGYMINNLLLHTDVCCIGIDFVSSEYEKYDIRAVKIKGCEKFLTIGYVKLSNGTLSQEGRQYINRLRQLLAETGEEKGGRKADITVCYN